MIMLIDGKYGPSFRPPAAEPAAPVQPPAEPPAPPPPPPATTASVQQKTQTAQQAQATADRAARNLDDDRASFQQMQHVAHLQIDAAQAWKDVETEVRHLYTQPPTLDETRQATAPASVWTAGQATPKQQAAVVQVRHIENTTTSLQASGATDPHFQSIVMTAQADAAAQAAKDLQPPEPQWSGLPVLGGPANVSAAAARARELEIVGRAAASDDPMATLDRLAPQGAARWTPEVRARVEAQVFGAGDAGIADAYRSGGAQAATDVLRQRVEGASDPAAAAAWVARAQPLVRQAGALLAGDARLADLNTHLDVQARFDAVSGDLSAIYEVAAQGGRGSDTPAARSVLKAVTDGVGKNVGRYDEALAHAAMADGHAALAIDTVAALQAGGKARQADQILNRATEAFDAVADKAQAAQDDLTQRQLAAQSYVAKAAPFSTTAGVNEALKEYWAQPDQKASKAAADQASLLALKGAAALETMAGKVTDGNHVDDAQARVDKYTAADSTLLAVSSSDAAQAWIAARQFGSAGGSTGFLSPDQLGRAVIAADHPDDARATWQGLLTQVGLGQAVSAKVAGSTEGAEAAVRSLGRYDTLFGQGDPAYAARTAALLQMARARSEEQAESALQGWASLVNTASNGPVSNGAAALLAVAGTGMDLNNLRDHAGLQAVLGTGVDAAQALVNVRTARAALQGPVPKFLETQARWVNGAGAVLATVDAVATLASDADGVTKGLKSTAAIGSIMIAAAAEGSWLGPAGVAISLASTAALMIHSRVEASNRYETGDATRFIAKASHLNGSGDEPVAYQLRNDDSNGQNHNEVIYRAVAQHLGIAADFSDGSKAQVVTWLNKRSSEDVGRLADTAARIGFETVETGTGADAVDGNGQVYAQTASNDMLIATVPASKAPYVPDLQPRSVDGLAAWIARNI